MRSLGRQIRLVTLDLDDTLIDTDATAGERVADAMRMAAEQLGDSLDADSAARIEAAVVAADPITPGRLAVMFDLLGITAGHPAAVRIREAYNSRLVSLIELFDDVPATLAALRERYTIAIVTNGPVWMQQAKLERFGLERQVDHVVISEAVGAHKPDRAIFDHAASLAGVPASQAVHVGDSLFTDVGGAQGAGFAAVWLPPKAARTPMEQPPTPELVIDHIRDLRTLLCL